MYDSQETDRCPGWDGESWGKLCLNVRGDEKRHDESYVSFWLEAGNRQSPTWKEHEDINAVMLATALAPEGFLVLSGQSFA